MPYIPHTEFDVKAMLASMELSSSEELFDEIPKALRCGDLKSIPPKSNEMNMLLEADRLAAKNRLKCCFIGAGCYEHHIPAAVWDIAKRGEFLTAYTPYQAEASQGTLQLLYEFQSMIAELTGMEVANASLYDGASALAEAVLMALRIKKVSERKVLIPTGLHPFYRETLKTIVSNQGIELIDLPLELERGLIHQDSLADYVGKEVAALVIAQPNFFGCLEEVDFLTDWARDNDILSIACVNPTSLALLKPPGCWGQKGVDIVCGEGQPLGVPMASGGPYFGFFSTRMAYVRQMPGRLIGRTVDKEGKPGFTLTLQAREQHIRRGKATSNICTNQGLLVTAASIYLSLLGPKGLLAVAEACHRKTLKLINGLTKIPGVTQVFSQPFFHEAVLKFDKPLPAILSALETYGLSGGFALEPYYPRLENSLLVCATERRTEDEIELYIHALSEVMTGK